MNHATSFYAPYHFIKCSCFKFFVFNYLIQYIFQLFYRVALVEFARCQVENLSGGLSPPLATNLNLTNVLDHTNIVVGLVPYNHNGHRQENLHEPISGNILGNHIVYSNSAWHQPVEFIDTDIDMPAMEDASTGNHRVDVPEAINKSVGTVSLDGIFCAHANKITTNIPVVIGPKSSRSSPNVMVPNAIMANIAVATSTPAILGRLFNQAVRSSPAPTPQHYPRRNSNADMISRVKTPIVVTFGNTQSSNFVSGVIQNAREQSSLLSRRGSIQVRTVTPAPAASPQPKSSKLYSSQTMFTQNIGAIKPALSPPRLSTLHTMVAIKPFVMKATSISESENPQQVFPFTTIKQPQCIPAFAAKIIPAEMINTIAPLGISLLSSKMMGSQFAPTAVLQTTTAPPTAVLQTTTAPSTDVLQNTTAPSTDVLQTTTAPSTDVRQTTTAPSTDVLQNTTAPSTAVLQITTAPSTDMLQNTTAL